MVGNMFSMQFISLDAIFSLIAGMEARCKGYLDLLKPSRHSALPTLPNKDDLLETKTRKRVSYFLLLFLYLSIFEKLNNSIFFSG